MRRRVLLVAKIMGLVCVAASRVRGDEPVVPVYHEPHHRQVFQYGPTRILDLQIPPGTTTWFHTHESPILYINLSSSPSRTQILGQDWATGGPPRAAASNVDRGAAPPAPAGPRVTSTTGYATQPLTHRLQNVGDRLVRAIVVINETAGEEATPEQAAGFETKAELVNRWFRAYRQALAPGESTPPHRHKAPVAIVQTSEGHGRAVGAMKFELNEPGQWSFFDAGDAHEIRNTGDARVEFVEVELRQPR